LIGNGMKRHLAQKILMGLHYGPAIAVTSNERMDYFGRVVNIAARLGSVNEGDDVIISASCFEDENVQEILLEYSTSIETFQARLKGIEGEVSAFRARLPQAAHTS
jgi:class 3 adenylate cyclase